MKETFPATLPPGSKNYHEQVRDYYGRVLGGSGDLKTSACCTTESLPALYKQILSQIAPEVLERFYGCGSPIPPALEGRTVLDLGCGTGRDAYLASKLVGPSGQVIGVDMTEEQLAVARRHLEAQMRAFGFVRPNVGFRHGLIEDLRAVDIADESVDVVISNCVVNLSPDKPKVLAEIFRVLKPGGELYFSDVFSDRRVPAALRDDPELYGECLGGALYFEDFRRLLLGLGCRDFRTLDRRTITIGDATLADKCGLIGFSSLTLRAFKLSSLEDRCEDYGQVATYLGTLPGLSHRFDLDAEHCFEAHKTERVCGNTAAMLQETRYASHFEVRGNRSRHLGLFDCAPGAASSSDCSRGGACC